MVAPKSIQENESLVSPTEAAKILGVHRSTIHNWLRDGLITGERHGSFHAIARQEIERFSRDYIDGDPAAKSAAKTSNKRRKAK